MRKTYAFYYSLIAIISLAIVVNTIYTGSQYVHHGKQFKNLSIEKNNLETQKSKLQLALAKEQNINSLQTFVLSEQFEIISNVEYIAKSSALASR